MQRESFLREQYVLQSNDSKLKSESISAIHASLDPRFYILLSRTANNQKKATSTDRIHSPNTANPNLNAWSPIKASNERSGKTCLSTAWKNRLQGLLVGLAIAAISVAIILSVLLTRSTTISTTSTSTTTPACSSLQWSQISVTVAGNGTAGSTANLFNTPWGIYVTSNYTIYVADHANHRVQQWPLNAVSGNTVAGVTGVPGFTGSYLTNPTAVYFDSQQNLYVADGYGISVWAPGASTGNRIASSSGFTSIFSLYIDTSGNLYANVVASCTIQMWTSLANSSITVAGGTGCGYSSTQLSFTYGFTVNSQTNTIYAAAYDTYTIIAWPIRGSSGTIVAGTNFSYGTTDSLLNRPTDIKTDPYGNLYVADAGNNRVLLFCQNPASTSASIIAGSELAYPTTIALDSNLNLYVVNNNQIQKYTRIT